MLINFFLICMFLWYDPCNTTVTQVIARKVIRFQYFFFFFLYIDLMTRLSCSFTAETEEILKACFLFLFKQIDLWFAAGIHSHAVLDSSLCVNLSMEKPRSQWFVHEWEQLIKNTTSQGCSPEDTQVNRMKYWIHYHSRPKDEIYRRRAQTWDDACRRSAYKGLKIIHLMIHRQLTQSTKNLTYPHLGETVLSIRIGVELQRLLCPDYLKQSEMMQKRRERGMREQSMAPIT